MATPTMPTAIDKLALFDTVETIRHHTTCMVRSLPDDVDVTGVPVLGPMIVTGQQRYINNMRLVLRYLKQVGKACKHQQAHDAYQRVQDWRVCVKFAHDLDEQTAQLLLCHDNDNYAQDGVFFRNEGIDIQATQDSADSPNTPSDSNTRDIPSIPHIPHIPDTRVTSALSADSPNSSTREGPLLVVSASTGFDNTAWLPNFSGPSIGDDHGDVDVTKWIGDCVIEVDADKKLPAAAADEPASRSTSSSTSNQSTTDQNSNDQDQVAIQHQHWTTTLASGEAGSAGHEFAARDWLEDATNKANDGCKDHVNDDDKDKDNEKANDYCLTTTEQERDHTVDAWQPSAQDEVTDEEGLEFEFDFDYPLEQTEDKGTIDEEILLGQDKATTKAQGNPATLTTRPVIRNDDSVSKDVENHSAVEEHEQEQQQQAETPEPKVYDDLLHIFLFSRDDEPSPTHADSVHNLENISAADQPTHLHRVHSDSHSLVPAHEPDMEVPRASEQEGEEHETTVPDVAEHGNSLHVVSLPNEADLMVDVVGKAVSLHGRPIAEEREPELLTSMEELDAVVELEVQKLEQKQPETMTALNDVAPVKHELQTTVGTSTEAEIEGEARAQAADIHAGHTKEHNNLNHVFLFSRDDACGVDLASLALELEADEADQPGMGDCEGAKVIEMATDEIPASANSGTRDLMAISEVIQPVTGESTEQFKEPTRNTNLAAGVNAANVNECECDDLTHVFLFPREDGNGNGNGPAAEESVESDEIHQQTNFKQDLLRVEQDERICDSDWDQHGNDNNHSPEDGQDDRQIEDNHDHGIGENHDACEIETEISGQVHWSDSEPETPTTVPTEGTEAVALEEPQQPEEHAASLAMTIRLALTVTEETVHDLDAVFIEPYVEDDSTLIADETPSTLKLLQVGGVWDIMIESESESESTATSTMSNEDNDNNEDNKANKENDNNTDNKGNDEDGNDNIDSNADEQHINNDENGHDGDGDGDGNDETEQTSLDNNINSQPTECEQEHEHKHDTSAVESVNSDSYRPPEWSLSTILLGMTAGAIVVAARAPVFSAFLLCGGIAYVKYCTG